MTDADTSEQHDGVSSPASTLHTSEHATSDAAAYASAKGRGALATNEGEGLYRLLVESVMDYAIFALDEDGCVLSWNAGAERFKGYSAEEIIGKHFSIFYTQVDKDARKPQWEIEVATRDGRVEDEGWRVRKDGSVFWANVVITALRNDTGKLVGFAKVTRDLTERRAAEQRAIADAGRLAVLEDANRAKSGFLAAMSHELRTPLNAIAGYADLLLSGVGGTLSEQQCDYVERMRRSQQHLLSVINDILNYSRIEAGQLDYDIDTVSLAKVIDAVLPMIEPQATVKALELERSACTVPNVRGDRAKIEQILLNFLSNAVKFTLSGGRISVSCERADPYVRLHVTDTGIGIPESELQSIFEPFVQVSRSLTSAHEGTGLGLAISQDLAEGMQGSVTVKSELGVGSTFTLSLPIDAA